MLYNKDWEKLPDTPMSRVLNTAADLLEKHGHIKGRLWGENGSMCFMGAIYKAINKDDAAVPTKEVTEHVLKAMNMPVASYPVISNWQTGEYIYIPSPISTIVDWNNAPERTAQEVIDAMRLAAKVPEEVS